MYIKIFNVSVFNLRCLASNGWIYEVLILGIAKYKFKQLKQSWNELDLTLNFWGFALKQH